MMFLSAAATTVPPDSTQQAIGYPTLFLLVLIGALVPVVPTGALVSSAAVVAFHQTAPFSMLLVFGVSALAAFLGDVALYWLGRRGMGSKNGSRWLQAIRDRAPEDRLAQAQDKLSDHGVAVLVLSRPLWRKHPQGIARAAVRHGSRLHAQSLEDAFGSEMHRAADAVIPVSVLCRVFA